MSIVPFVGKQHEPAVAMGDAAEPARADMLLDAVLERDHERATLAKETAAKKRASLKAEELAKARSLLAQDIATSVRPTQKPKAATSVIPSAKPKAAAPSAKLSITPSKTPQGAVATSAEKTAGPVMKTELKAAMDKLKQAKKDARTAGHKIKVDNEDSRQHYLVRLPGKPSVQIKYGPSQTQLQACEKAVAMLRQFIENT